MRIDCVAFTRGGCELACLLREGLVRQGNEVEVFSPARLASEELAVRAYDSLASWTERAFAEADALLFVSAAGIAVRSIAPHAHDKLSDPAVVCVDEGGGFVVPLLSGHVGGANELARQVAELCGGQAVVTTATDVRGCFAVDEWAASQGFALLDRMEIKRVSSLLLEGEPVGFASDVAVRGDLPEGLVADDGAACETGVSVSLDPGRRPFAHTLRLVPRVVVVGVGCRRGTPAERIEALVDACLAEAHVAPEAVLTLATIDVKAHEEGLLAVAQARGWELSLLSAGELAAVPGTFASSEFVRQTVGVDNVCERAACAGGGSLLLPKHAEGGVTVALGIAPDVHVDFSSGRGRAHAGVSPHSPQHVAPDASVSPQHVAPDASVSPKVGDSTKVGGSKVGSFSSHISDLRFCKTSHFKTSHFSELKSRREAEGAIDGVKCADVGEKDTADMAYGAVIGVAGAQCVATAEGAAGCVAGDPTRRGSLACVGLGPGAAEDLTLRARKALESAEVIVGYTTYVSLVRDAYPAAEFVTTPMRREEERCRLALKRAAAGQRVALVCSGDPGVYGMAGLLLELAEDYPGVAVEVVPGVTAATGGAALLGAPLMNDWCTISLSDIMTSWEVIEARLRAAARAGLVICLYNPGSRGRTDHLRRACDVLLEVLAPSTTCGMARAVGRSGEESRVLTLEELRNESADMLTCVFVGNSQTHELGGRMVTPRGYRLGTHGKTHAQGAEGNADTSRGQGKGLARILLFGGTTEGRQLAEWLARRGTCQVIACAATDYGARLLDVGEGVEVHAGALSSEDKRELMASHDFACIVDATHPYAQHISASVDELGRTYGVDVLRIARDEGDCDAGEKGDGEAWTSCASPEVAAAYVARRGGRVLLTTGTRDLNTFVRAMPDYAERLYVRVLPVPASLAAVDEVGIPASHVIAMQGPFSTRLNEALIDELAIDCMVTKRSGSAGGFAQKAEAARSRGVELVVVERPPQREGVSLEEAKELLEARYGA